MKMLTFAAGLAAGYGLGTRAGRERFDQLVQKARDLGDHPTVTQAEQKAKDLVGAATGRGNSTAPRTRKSADLPSSAYTTSPERAPGAPGAASAGGLAEPIG